MFTENENRKKYLYGIGQCDPSQPLGIAGIDDAPVTYIAHNSICAAVSDFGHDDFAQDIDAIALHENVLDQLMQKFPLLPARVGTILTENQIAGLLDEHYESFLADLDRVRDRVEFALKVLWPASELRSLIEHNDPYISAFAKLEKTSGPGVRYALYKRREQAVEELLRSKAQAYMESIQGSLLPISSDARCEMMPNDGVLLEGSYLVQRGQSTGFRGTVDSLQAQSPKFCFVITGPWPPYSFMSLNSRLMEKPAAVREISLPSPLVH